MSNKTYLILSLLILAAATGLIACSSVDSRYSDNEFLERPPTLAATDHTSATEQGAITRAEAPVKPDKGLGSDISINSSSPLQINLTRAFDIAWHDVELALKGLELDITDREHDKGQYYVTYDADDYRPEDSGLLDKSTSFFKNDYKEAIYILTVEQDGDNATRITAALANETEQTGDGKEAGSANLTDGADRLLLTLYRHMRNQLVED